MSRGPSALGRYHAARVTYNVVPVVLELPSIIHRVSDIARLPPVVYYIEETRTGWVAVEEYFYLIALMGDVPRLLHIGRGRIVLVIWQELTLHHGGQRHPVNASP